VPRTSSMTMVPLRVAKSELTSCIPTFAKIAARASNAAGSSVQNCHDGSAVFKSSPSDQMADDEQTGEQASKRHADRGRNVKGSHAQLPAFVQQGYVERECRKGRKAA
jgi:hypothetical protein